MRIEIHDTDMMEQAFLKICDSSSVRFILHSASLRVPRFPTHIYVYALVLRERKCTTRARCRLWASPFARPSCQIQTKLAEFSRRGSCTSGVFVAGVFCSYIRVYTRHIATRPRSTMTTRCFVGMRIRLCLCVISATLSAQVMAINDTDVPPTTHAASTPYNPPTYATFFPEGPPSPFSEQPPRGSNDELSDSQARFFAGIPVNVSVFSMGNTNQEVQVAILIEGTASIRLRESNPQDIDYAVAQWHEYCVEYIRKA